MIPNRQEITNIEIRPKAICFCPLGKDWYVNEFVIGFGVGSQIPDYCELDKWIQENIEGKEMIVEDAVASLYDHVKEKYNPYFLIVQSHVARGTHSEVLVTKTD